VEFKFDANQSYQRDAIAAVVDLFEGQPRDVSNLETSLSNQFLEVGNQAVLDMVNEVGAVGNRIVLDHSTLLHNLQVVQDRMAWKLLIQSLGIVSVLI